MASWILEEMARQTAEEAMNTFVYEGKTLREWVEIIAKEPKNKSGHNEAEDLVPVVRCKDCDWRKKNTFCLKHMHYVKDDYFCADGARMDGEAE